jgi:hypothetical protein
LKVEAKDITEDTIRIPAGNTKTLRYREVPIIPAAASMAGLPAHADQL